MKNIYLVGFMGTGKTTVAQLLAKDLNKEFIEMDTLIEAEQNESISNIFTTKGENYFRALEHALLEKLAKKTNLVVSCGGGIVINPQNLLILKNSGHLINLSANVETIYARTKNFTHRPLLNVANPKAAIEQLLTQRQPYYAQAEFTIETDKLNPQGIVKQIKQLLNI